MNAQTIAILIVYYVTVVILFYGVLLLETFKNSIDGPGRKYRYLLKLLIAVVWPLVAAGILWLWLRDKLGFK